MGNYRFCGKLQVNIFTARNLMGNYRFCGKLQENIDTAGNIMGNYRFCGKLQVPDSARNFKYSNYGTST